MASVNKVILIGNCGRDPEIRYLPSGQAVANVSIATTSRRKDRNSGETVEDTQWHRVTFYDRLAEIAGEYVKKGRPIYVEGRLKYGKYTDQSGVEKNTVDIIATDIDDLLTQLDGVTVTVIDEPVTLATAGALIRPLEMNGFQQFLNFITNPSVATILLTLGSIGLIAEIYNPGTFVPGTVGLISLLLGLYALGQLDANFAGLALIVLALILFVAEAVTPTFGALATGGIAAFIFGSMLLFDAPGLSIPWPLIITLAVGMGAFTVFAGGKALSIQRRQPRTGSEAMIGKSAQVRAAFDDEGHGKVFHAGELWNAEIPNLESGQPKPVLGDTVVIEAVKGYTLVVRYMK